MGPRERPKRSGMLAARGSIEMLEVLSQEEGDGVDTRERLLYEQETRRPVSEPRQKTCLLLMVMI